MTNPSDYTLAQAADPSTPAALLGEIATHRPDLRPAIAANPTAYPELLDWLRAFGDPTIDAALAARGSAPAAGYGYGAPAQDPSVTQPLPSGYGAYGVSPTTPSTTPPAVEQASQWGPPAAEQTAAWGQQPPAGQGAWNQQQDPAGQAAWGQQPPAGQGAWNQQQDPAWGQQPAGASSTAWSQPQPQPQPKASSRRGLWIGVSVVGVLVVAGAAFAANALWFSKVGGAKTPEAAVTQMMDAAVSKDLVALYGVTSPSEFESATTGMSLFMDRMSEDSDLDTGALKDVYEDYLEAFDLSMDGLEVEVEEIEDGLAKVSVVAGELTIDADAEELSDATIAAMDQLESGPMSELFALSGTSMPTDAEVREEMNTAVAETFPVDVSAADLEDPFLMVVREGGSWYVSPMLTMLEYGAVAEGVERGSLPASDLAGQFDSPEAAADGLVDSITEYLSTGDESALLSTLPLADRRALSLYGNFDEIDVAELAELQELLETSTIDASFAVRDEDDGVAWLQLETFSFTGEFDGVASTLELDGECVSADVDGQAINACLDDIPALKELGLGDLSLIAVEEDGSWYISYAGTVGDASGVVLANVMRLYEEGKLTDMQWWSDNLGILGDELF